MVILMNENNLEVKNLEITYPHGKFHLDKVSFSVPKGAIVGLIGENGSGKTTTMNLILDLRKKDAGVVKIFDQEFNIDDIGMKEKLGVSFDDVVLPTKLTAKEVSKMYGLFYEKWDEAFFLNTLSKFGIDSNKKISEYSKGMQKMFSILLSMSYYPNLLILDEPTSTLDPVRRQEILEVFKSYAKNKENSILFSSHITTDIEHISDFVVYIHEGKLIFFEPINKLLSEYAVIKCTKEIFDHIPENKIVSFHAQATEYIVLLNSRKELNKFKSGLVIESPTLEEIMNMFSKGAVL